VREVEIGIVTAGDPCVAAGPKHVGELAPAVASRLSGMWNGIEPPELLARSGVIRADETTLFFEAVATLKALQHLAFDNDGTTGVREPLGSVRNHGLPDQPAAPRVECYQVRVARGEENPVLVDGESAVGGAAKAHFATSPILPNQITRLAIKCLNDVARVLEVDDAVVNERGW